MKLSRFRDFLQIVHAYGMLIYFDSYIARNRFATLHNKVRHFPVANRRPSPETVPGACRAVDIASVCYWKQALCLHRSAAATCLLRRLGVPAQMVIGVQQFPFRAHAWVEVDGRVVNDRSQVRDKFAVLDCC
jgi:transglutaminase superfamily protein